MDYSYWDMNRLRVAALCRFSPDANQHSDQGVVGQVFEVPLGVLLLSRGDPDGCLSLDNGI
jgi:hypothetical protein